MWELIPNKKIRLTLQAIVGVAILLISIKTSLDLVYGQPTKYVNPNIIVTDQKLDNYFKGKEVITRDNLSSELNNEHVVREQQLHLELKTMEVKVDGYQKDIDYIKRLIDSQNSMLERQDKKIDQLLLRYTK